MTGDEDEDDNDEDDDRAATSSGSSGDTVERVGARTATVEDTSAGPRVGAARATEVGSDLCGGTEFVAQGDPRTERATAGRGKPALGRVLTISSSNEGDRTRLRFVDETAAVEDGTGVDVLLFFLTDVEPKVGVETAASASRAGSFGVARDCVGGGGDTEYDCKTVLRPEAYEYEMLATAPSVAVSSVQRVWCLFLAGDERGGVVPPPLVTFSIAFWLRERNISGPAAVLVLFRSGSNESKAGGADTRGRLAAAAVDGGDESLTSLVHGIGFELMDVAGVAGVGVGTTRRISSSDSRSGACERALMRGMRCLCTR